MTTSAATVEESLGRAWRQALTREEVTSLLEMNDLRSWLSIATNWALVFTAFGLVAIWPNPISIPQTAPVLSAGNLSRTRKPRRWLKRVAQLVATGPLVLQQRVDDLPAVVAVVADEGV